MENKELVRVFTGTSIVVSRAVSLLEENNISTFTKDNAESARMAGFGAPPNSVELHVTADNSERAYQILKEANLGNESLG